MAAHGHVLFGRWRQMSGDRVIVHRGGWSRACCASKRGQGRPWAFVLQVWRGGSGGRPGSVRHVSPCVFLQSG
eukprot:2139629-Alexandrium_andersonii.AAC.1